MEQRRNRPATKKVIPLDGDKLGMIVGLLGAITVLLIGVLANRGDLPTILIRVGWTFVICYGATFFLVRVILRTTLHEMIEKEKLERERERALRKAHVKEEAEHERKYEHEIEDELPSEPMSE